MTAKTKRTKASPEAAINHHVQIADQIEKGLDDAQNAIWALHEVLGKIGDDSTAFLVRQYLSPVAEDLNSIAIQFNAIREKEADAA